MPVFDMYQYGSWVAQFKAKKMKKAFLLLATSLLLSLSASSHAALSAGQQMDMTRWYKIYWSGFHVADLKARLTDDSLKTIIESYGVVKQISKYSSKTTSEFKFTEGNYIPESFYTEFRQRKNSRTIDIKYTPQGAILEEAVTPPDNRAKRPAVDAALKQDAVDPLTAVVIARQRIKESLVNGDKNFSFKMYDGRRLSMLAFSVKGREVQEIGAKEHNVVTVTFQRLPIAGYTNNEMTRLKGEEPLFTLHLSDDDLLLPIKAYAKAALGSAVLILEKECPSLEACG